ncbi:MAG: alpha,alpha-trehalose-phosphate synthase (UDP-forming) [Acidimicrobiales bacterium]
MDSSDAASGGPAGAPLVVVANRLPVRCVEHDGEMRWDLSPGGLVSALTPALAGGAGMWIGWPGDGVDLAVPAQHEGIELRAVPLDDAEFEQFYLGFSNATLWPLYHDAIRTPTFHREWWYAYMSVNDRYARAVAEAAAPGATVWVHDYQLQLVPKILRAMRPDLRIGFFLHIPFPPQELFLQLPWRRPIIEGLLGADLVGFQVQGAASNFSRVARRVVGASGTDAILDYDGRQVRVGAFPISVDTTALIKRASDPAVQGRARQIREELGSPDVVMLGVDRLDYTKGIDRRLIAVGELFAEGFLSTSRAVLVQIGVPSREEDPHYRREREHLEQLVGEINGEHSSVGRSAIHYLYQSVEVDELVALYLAADVMLVTPLRDGMNLVAKEYVACRVDATGALVLSEFAGAARELRNAAILVNPHDLDGLKQAIRHAVDLDPTEGTARMRRMQRIVRRHDVQAWARTFLAALHTDSSHISTTPDPG